MSSKSGTGDGQRTKEMRKNLKTKFEKTSKKGRKTVKNGEISLLLYFFIVIQWLICCLSVCSNSEAITIQVTLWNTPLPGYKIPSTTSFNVNFSGLHHQLINFFLINFHSIPLTSSSKLHLQLINFYILNQFFQKLRVLGASIWGFDTRFG